MIISRTPFRVSFLGGGTDLPEFYREEEGAVLSCTINKYMYLTVNDRFDNTYRLSYSKTEIQPRLDAIEHPIFKTVLGKYEKQIQAKNPGRGLEILSMADIPSGTGLGSSSSFTVGLLHALKGHLGISQTAEDLASEASRIEIEDLKEPIGKQDQYAAAYGGLMFIRFKPSGDVSVDPVVCSSGLKQNLEQSMMLFYTGMTRAASSVLSEQKKATSNKRETLRGMKNLAEKSFHALTGQGDLQKFGEYLHEGWLLKKSLVSGISQPKIDEWYEAARKEGAWGGKILGAGGGGFLMLLAHPDKHDRIRAALAELRFLPVALEPWGSKIIFCG